MIYRAKVSGDEGLAIIDFDARGYKVFDEHNRLVKAFVKDNKVYVKVNKGTRYIYFVKDGSEAVPDDKSFLVNDFQVIKYEDCKNGKELQGFDGTLINGEKNTATHLYTEREIGTSFYLELDYDYEGQGDNLIVGFLAKGEPDSKANCHGQLLGGCDKYYAKGSYAIGFNPMYSKNTLVLITPDGNCQPFPVSNIEVTGKHTLRLIFDHGSFVAFFDETRVIPYISSDSRPGRVYVVGNSGAASSRIKINSMILYDGKLSDEVKEVQQVGFDEVRISNFKGVSEGTVKLGKANVIIGANNAGKTTILEALYLLASAEQVPVAFNDSIELLAYIHDIRENPMQSKFLFRFYNTRTPIKIEGGERKVEITYNGNFVVKKVTEKDKEVKGGEPRALFVNSSLLKRYLLYIGLNWEEISNMTEVINEVISEINEVNNEEYMETITYEPFSGQNTFYFIRRSDSKRVRLVDLGEGLQTFVTVRLLYEYLKPGLILWDDIESHLNPKLLGRIIAWFDDIPGQIVVTTHNLFVAKDIVESLNAKCLAVDIAKDGKLIVEEIDDLSRYIDLGLDPREIVRGKVVG
ncbi:MAG: AAA family ATPase [Sulfolobaceae archaeon]|nr:AAA family ATPase [Sulfolobaceae archaeon]